MLRNTNRGVRFGALLAVVALVGCSEDLTAVTATWNQLQSTMTAKAAELRKQFNDVAAAVKAMPAPAATDTDGQTLVGKLKAALAGHEKLLAGLDSTIATAASSVQEAIKTGKVVNIQKAIDDSKTAYDGVIGKIGGSTAAVTALFGQVKAHYAQLAAEAARVNTAGTRVDFTDIDFKPGKAELLFDRPNTLANLDKLLVFVNSCPELAVDIVGHSSNEGTPAFNAKVSVDRAKTVQKWLLGKGVAKKKIHGLSGKGATDNVVAEPAPNSDAAKKMPAMALEELRRKNRRVTVVVVTPCTPK